MLFACIYVPEFPVQAIARTTPELREQAVAVLDGTPPMLTVIAANARARESGIDVGMTKLQAEACPHVHLRRRSLIEEAAANAALLDGAYAFSPRVENTNRYGLHSKKWGDTVILDISGLERLFGSPARIARDLTSRIAKMGLHVNVAVACNADAAMHAARGFSGVTILAPGMAATRLGALPVFLLEPSEDMLETLERWGIRDFRGLAVATEAFIEHVDARLARSFDSERVLDEWRRLSVHANGDRVTCVIGEQTVSGAWSGIDEHGRAMLRHGDGLTTVSAGDLILS